MLEYTRSKSNLPRRFSQGDESIMDSFVASLTEALFHKADTPLRKVSIPFDTITDFRINYISKNCGATFTSIVVNLIDSALPILEQRLDITEEEIVENYNKELPEGETPLMTTAQFEKMVEERRKEVK
jgi:hypothetical protein